MASKNIPNLPKIPLLSVPDTPLTATSQNFVPVADIVDDIVLFKDGGACVVLESTSLNFGLLSEKEQQAAIAAYAALINSFTFPMQITVRSQKKDISSYIKFIENAYQKVTEEKLKKLMLGYKTFVEETIKKKNVLSKKFYITIPFSNLELGVAKSFRLSATKYETLPYTKSYILKKVKTVLIPKRDHIMRQAGRLGLKLTPLKTPQIIELLYNVYNPIMAQKGVRIENEIA